MNSEALKTILEPNHKPLVFPKTIVDFVDFVDLFNTDEKCLNYITNIKWGNGGWICPYCNNKKFWLKQRNNIIHCVNCGYEESFIANTTMRYTKTSIRYWFIAMYLVATYKAGLSAMELYRQLNFGCYETAWTWLHKIRMAMTNPERTKLSGEIEVDETYIQTGTGEKGRKLGGEATLVVCAVEMKYSKKGYPASGRIRLRQIPDASADSLHSFVLDNVEIGSTVKTDGWRGYSGLEDYGYNHFVDVIRDPSEASKKFPRVHRIFSNLKAWLIGTHRFVSIKHMQNYLNEYTFRFNRRGNVKRVFNDLLKIAVSMPARTLKEFTEPERVYYINPEIKNGKL